MALPAKIQVPGNVVGSDGRLDVVLDDGAIIEVPTITSGKVAETPAITNANGAPVADWIDASGTPAATATCSSIAGRVALDAGRTTVVVTNTKVGVGAMIRLHKLTLDATATDFKVGVNVAGGEFTITSNAAATADVYFDFEVVNVNDVTPE